MQKTKCYLAALVSGVLLVTGILAGCGQSKKDDHLTVYLWENRLMKNIAPYIHEQFQIRILNLLLEIMTLIYIAILKSMVSCRTS